MAVTHPWVQEWILEPSETEETAQRDRTQVQQWHRSCGVSRGPSSFPLPTLSPHPFPAGELGQTTRGAQPDPSTPCCRSSHILEIGSQRGPPPGWGWDRGHRGGVSTARPQHPRHRAEGASAPGTTAHVSTGLGLRGHLQLRWHPAARRQTRCLARGRVEAVKSSSVGLTRLNSASAGANLVQTTAA